MADDPTGDPAPADPAPNGAVATDGVGLRKRKKLAMRRALQRAALRLASEQGLDITVDDICAAVDVSPRTFFNYFATKAEAILGEPPEPPSEDVLAVFEAGGPTGTLRDDLRAMLGPHLRDTLPTIREMHLRRQVLDAHPELVPYFMASFMAIEQRLVQAAARRLDVDPDHLHAQLVGTAASTCMRLAVRRWASAGGTDDVDAHLGQVLDALDLLTT